ncbi:cell filamentation protein Fic (plasmid) [Fulvitalea axinellae]|uniref:Cell filamentation protein Fic n=1 Tax=Fulvitalea axinellae TaxID=1182444 RepID=A0AAU9CYW8_9BACT|nr:cell filamentation protein Fic [Fulvitalea axinellae]
MKPPYQITKNILSLVSSIAEKIGEVNAAKLNRPPTELRKKNRIKTIQSSLEIEGNTMTVEQITDLLGDKRVLAPKKDIIEVKNAVDLYSRLDDFDPYNPESLLQAHAILMKGLVDQPGKYRNTAVGIVKGEQVAHIAPPGHMVTALVNDLFAYLRDDDDLPLIKSCVFHYEFEFIHPFPDGNGRMGRLWQTLLLREYSPVFEFLPIETLVKDRQEEYYRILNLSDRSGHSTPFVEFMLHIIRDALEDLLRTQTPSLTGHDRISLFQDHVKNGWFTRQEYLRHNKDISPATASRDLKTAVDNQTLEKSGDKRTAKYRFL